MNGYTQEEISNYLEISQPLYSQVENGNRPLREKYLEPLSLLYGFTLQELLGDTLKMLEDKTFNMLSENHNFIEYATNDMNFDAIAGDLV